MTDYDLARARNDAAFRQQFLVEHLEQLLEALKRARNASDPGPLTARQIREGVNLAVILAERLQATAKSRGTQVT